jgi:hypothetical protein
MKKLVYVFATVALMFSMTVNADNGEPKQKKKKAKTEKSCTTEEKKECSTEKKAGCCASKKAEEKKA